MYSIHNEGKLVIAQVFVKQLMSRIYKRMTANNSKSYLNYLNKLLGEYDDTYYRSIGKKPIDADYSDLTEEIESIYKAPKFRVGDRGRISIYKNNFSKGYTKNWSREMFAIDSVLKTNFWANKVKDLNGQKTKVSFKKKNCYWVNHKWVFSRTKQSY